MAASPDVEHRVQVVGMFDGLLKAETEIDESRYHEKPGYFQDYRVLKNTLRSTQFLRYQLDPEDSKAIVKHLLQSERYSGPFKELVKKTEFERRHLTLPKNYQLIYSVAETQI